MYRIVTDNQIDFDMPDFEHSSWISVVKARSQDSRPAGGLQNVESLFKICRLRAVMDMAP